MICGPLPDRGGCPFLPRWPRRPRNFYLASSPCFIFPGTASLSLSKFQSSFSEAPLVFPLLQQICALSYIAPFLSPALPPRGAFSSPKFEPLSLESSSAGGAPGKHCCRHAEAQGRFIHWPPRPQSSILLLTSRSNSQLGTLEHYPLLFAYPNFIY